MLAESVPEDSCAHDWSDRKGPREDRVPKSLSVVESTSLEPSRQYMGLLGMLHIQTVGGSVDVTEVRGLKGGVQ